MSHNKNRKNRQRGGPAEPDGIYWLPMTHTCGHRLDWGMALRRDYGHLDPANAEQVALMGGAFIEEFLRKNWSYPCPMCGSASNVKASPLKPGEKRFLVQSGAWYKLCDPDRYADADERGRAIRTLGKSLYPLQPGMSSN